MGEGYLKEADNKRNFADSKILNGLGYSTQVDKARLLEETLLSLSQKRKELNPLVNELFRRLKQVHGTSKRNITLSNKEVESIISGHKY